MFRAAAVAACMAARPAICEWDTASTLEPPAPEGNAGVAVAIGDGWIAVGAPFATVETRNEQGCVHIYGRTENGTWSFTTTLVSAAGAAYDRFGQALAASSNRLAVGAWGDDQRDAEAGAAHVYETDGTNWFWRAKLMAADGAAGLFFGAALALEGDTLAVGARKAPVGSKTAAGAVYVFRRDDGGTWQQREKLTADDAASYDYFGSAVAVDGDELLIGANDNDDNGSKSGSAYLFRNSAGGTGEWSQVALLLDAAGAQYDSLGSSVSLRGGIAAVGAPGVSSSAGAVCLFARDEGGSNVWGQVAKLLPAELPPGMGFGSAVALDDDGVFAGAPEASVAGPLGSGAVFLYEPAAGGSDWKEAQRLDPSPAAESERFGAALVRGAEWLVVGVPGSTNAGERAGTAIVFAVTESPAVLTGIAVMTNIVHVSWSGGTSHTQILERATSLQAADWTPVRTNLPPTPETGSHAEALGTRSFYRLLELNP